jgi:hypothetical protein
MIIYYQGIGVTTNNEEEALDAYQGIKVIKEHTHGSNDILGDSLITAIAMVHCNAPSSSVVACIYQ